jgi:hypothetical protein
MDPNIRHFLAVPTGALEQPGGWHSSLPALAGKMICEKEKVDQEHQSIWGYL